MKIADWPEPETNGVDTSVDDAQAEETTDSLQLYLRAIRRVPLLTSEQERDLFEGGPGRWGSSS